MDIEKLLAELESEMTDKRGLFAKKIDIEKCVDILYEMKEAIPQSIREAEYVINNKNRILENADNVAKNTIREAEERADHIIDNSELINRAQIEAKAIIDASYGQCDTLIEKTKVHLDNMFKDIEQFLLSNLTMVRTNREELRSAAVGKSTKKYQ